MREILFRGKRKDNGEWISGDLRQWSETSTGICARDLKRTFPVRPETVGQYTGVYDTELAPIYEGDIVRFLRYVGTVVFEEGCFGIAINETIDWDYIAEEMAEYAGTNPLSAVCNDNFISLWEILWNFNCSENVCNVVEVVGNIHDNPELLKGGEGHD